MSVSTTVEIDYGQLYIYSVDPPDGDVFLEALDDAYESRRFVGLRRGVIDVLVPIQWNFDARMEIQLWAAEPVSDDDDWDHVVDVDLDVRHNRICFEGSGGRPTLEHRVPSGRYRIRVSGQGYTEADENRASNADSYRVWLWPREGDSEPVLRKDWGRWRS